jgi:hypothetical protein
LVELAVTVVFVAVPIVSVAGSTYCGADAPAVKKYPAVPKVNLDSVVEALAYNISPVA